MPRMQKFILKACLAITSGLSTQTWPRMGFRSKRPKRLDDGWHGPCPAARRRSSARRTIGEPTVCAGRAKFPPSLNLQSGRIMWSVQVTGAESTPDFIHTFEMRRGQGLAAKVTPMVLVGLGSELLKFDGTNGHDQAGQHGPTSRHQPD